MKPFLKYLTEDSKSTIDNNSKLIEKKLKEHGVDLQSGVPGSVHDYFNGVMGEAPEHHKLWIAKRYVSGGVAHTEDIPGTLNLLRRHDELLGQGNISGGMLPKLKTNAELYSFVNKNDPDKDVAVGNEKINSELVKPHEYTVTGENAHWTEITPHTENASCYFGKGSNWCTAPTGNNSSNLFKDYIKQGPTHILIPKAPRYQGEKYQVHAPTQQVTDETNTSVDINKIENHDGSDQLLKPEHHRAFPAGNINNYKETVQTHADARHVDPAVAMPALAHPNSDKTTAFYAVQNQNPKIALAGLRHPKADQLAIEEGVFHNSSEVALAAVNHPMANLSTIAIGAAHRSPVVVMAALKHPYFGSNSKTLSNAAKHLDPAVAMAALQHPKADKYTTSAAAEHPDPAVAMAALNHKDANKYTTHNAAKHKDPAVVMAALNHKDATSITISTAARHSDPAVAMAALNHKDADTETTIKAAQHPDPAVAMAALQHKNATHKTAEIAIHHSDPAVKQAVLTYYDRLATGADKNISNLSESYSAVKIKPFIEYLVEDNDTLDYAILLESVLDEVPAAFEGPHPHETDNTYEEEKDSAIRDENWPPQADLGFTSTHIYQDPDSGIKTHIEMDYVTPGWEERKDRNQGVARCAVEANGMFGDSSQTGSRFNMPGEIMGKIASSFSHLHDFITKYKPHTIEYSTTDPKRHALYQHMGRLYPHITFKNIREVEPIKRKPKKALTDSVNTNYWNTANINKFILESPLDELPAAVKIKPFIRFLKEEDLTLEYHDTLNPKIWDGDELKPEVQAKLLQIAKKWATFAKIPDFAITDIILVGGNANYNWTKFSDLDLHLVVNREDLADCPDLLDDYLQNKKQLWALVHDITIYGHDVELYAQDKETPYPKKQGVYSVKGKKWIAQPKLEDVDFRGPALLAKVKQYTERIETLISTNAEDESFSKLKEKFKNMRSSGLKKIGEFSMENLVFKELRNRGVIDKMTKYLQSRLDQKLSLNENYPFQIQIHKKDGGKLVDVMQLNSETKTDAMGKGLRGLQDAKRNFKSKYPAAGDVADHQFSVRYPHDSSWITPTS